MLSALLLLGVMPLAALPFLQEDDLDADDDDSGEGSDPVMPTVGLGTVLTPETGGGASGSATISEVQYGSSVLTPETGPGPAGPGTITEVMNGSTGLVDPLDPVSPGSPVDAGTVHELGTVPESVIIDDFDPDGDTVVFDLTDFDGEFSLETSEGADGPMLTLDFGQGETTVRFPGLTDVPGDDIFLRLTDETTGEPYELSLSNAMSLQNLDVSDVTDPISLNGPTAPVPPTDPSLPGQPGPVTGPGVMPGDPTLPSQPGPGTPPGGVLQPVDPETPVYGPEGDQMLRSLLERDGGSSGDLGAVLRNTEATGTADTALGGGDDVFTQPDDGVAQATSLSLEEGAPVIVSDGPLAVIDGGTGNDEIGLDGEPGYAFGGEGDDTLSSGTGDAALYGGEGDDSLTANTDGTHRAFLDGGTGNDTILGGDGDDILEGGEHTGTGAGDDVIGGGAGNDLIRGGLGSDTLYGGDGDDVIDHAGRDMERQGAMRHEFDWHIDDATDVLFGGEGNDTLIFDQGDLASGGAGEDLFWVYHDGDAASDPALIADFEVGEDFLRVSLNPNIGENGEPDVVVEPSADGEDGLVIVNGNLVAILKGVPNATASDVYAEVTPDVFS